MDEYCGECFSKLTDENAWSNHTCVKCAIELGLTTEIAEIVKMWEKQGGIFIGNKQLTVVS